MSTIRDMDGPERKLYTLRIEQSAIDELIDDGDLTEIKQDNPIWKAAFDFYKTDNFVLYVAEKETK